MSLIVVGRSGPYYTLNGQRTAPRQLVFADMFKGRNHIAAWIFGKGGQHIDNFKRYIETWQRCGVRGFRIPPEVRFWGLPYFDRADYPNEKCFLDLSVPTGSGFRLTNGFKKQIRMMVRLAREMDVIFEIPWLWTIKGRGENDPRGTVSVWNEHYIANVGAYLHTLKSAGDGEGDHRVDPGGLNILSELANEYRVHADVFDEGQLRNIFRRWHTRDCPGELLGVSQSQPKHEYYPALGLGAESPDDIRLHPRRDGDWWNAPEEIKRKFSRYNVPLFANESIMHMTQTEWNYWLAVIPKWHGLATTNSERFLEMHRGFWDRGIYTTIHTMRGMDGGWPASAPGPLEAAIAEELGGSEPPAPAPQYAFEHIIQLAYREILERDADAGGIANYNALMESGMSEANLRETLMRSDEYRTKFGGGV